MSMKRAIILLLVLISCGPAQTTRTKVGGEVLGTTAQPIFMPTTYGAEMGGHQLECSPPWDGNGCAVPDSKAIRIEFVDNTCDPWFQERYMEIIDEMAGLLWGLGDDWGLFWGTGKYRLDCGDTTGFGSFSFKTGDTDKHSTPYGTLYQHKKGTLRIDTAAIVGHPRWAAATDAQRQFFTRNVTRQEYLHLLGHGHHKHEPGPDVMDGPDDSWWEEDKLPSQSMIDEMRCYNEDSGSSDDC